MPYSTAKGYYRSDEVNTEKVLPKCDLLVLSNSLLTMSPFLFFSASAYRLAAAISWDGPWQFARRFNRPALHSEGLQHMIISINNEYGHPHVLKICILRYFAIECSHCLSLLLGYLGELRFPMVI